MYVYIYIRVVRSTKKMLSRWQCAVPFWLKSPRCLELILDTWRTRSFSPHPPTPGAGIPGFPPCEKRWVPTLVVARHFAQVWDSLHRCIGYEGDAFSHRTIENGESWLSWLMVNLQFGAHVNQTISITIHDVRVFNAAYIFCFATQRQSHSIFYWEKWGSKDFQNPTVPQGSQGELLMDQNHLRTSEFSS